tara:strand:+ start:123 stop:1367 length:1245 start_codon:yes stop_codon:yes gene_type:complete
MPNSKNTITDKSKCAKKNISKKRGGTNANITIQELIKPKYTDEKTFINFQKNFKTLLQDTNIKTTIPTINDQLNTMINYYSSDQNTGSRDFILKFYMKFLLFSKIEKKWESIFIYLTLLKFNKKFNENSYDDVNILKNQEILKYLYYSLYSKTSKNKIITATTDYSKFTISNINYIKELYFKGEKFLKLYENYMFETEFIEKKNKSLKNIIKSLKEHYILDILLGSLIDDEMRFICVYKEGILYGHTPYVELKNKKGHLFYHFDIIENFDKHYKINGKSLSEYYDKPILHLESKSIDHDKYLCEHWFDKTTCNNYQHIAPNEYKFLFDPLINKDTFNLNFNNINKKLLSKIIGTKEEGTKRDGDIGLKGENLNYIKNIKIKDFKAIMKSPKEKNVIEFNPNQTILETFWESIFG